MINLFANSVLLMDNASKTAIKIAELVTAGGRRSAGLTVIR